MPPASTVADEIRLGVARLRAAESETARLDAELLLAWALGVDRTTILAHPEASVAGEALATYRAALDRRAAGEPIAYIRGLKEFFGLAFGVDRRALIPRPETERLVELALAELEARLTGAPRPAGTPRLRVVDVGTGAGPIVVTLAVTLRRRRMDGEVALWATEIDPDALALARENAVGHAVADAVSFVLADLLPDGAPPWVLICANLPYVRSAAVDELSVAASFEPRLALDGGPDGLAVVRRLVARLPTALTPDGVALLEIGADQASDVAALVEETLPGWVWHIEPDLAGLPRVLRLERGGRDAAGGGLGPARTAARTAGRVVQ